MNSCVGIHSRLYREEENINELEITSIGTIKTATQRKERVKQTQHQRSEIQHQMSNICAMRISEGEGERVRCKKHING